MQIWKRNNPKRVIQRCFNEFEWEIAQRDALIKAEFNFKYCIPSLITITYLLSVPSPSSSAPTFRVQLYNTYYQLHSYLRLIMFLEHSAAK